MSEEIIIKVQINNKVYPVSCAEGEEERVKKSAKLISDTIDSLNQQNNSASDNRLLVMASLILADKLENNSKDITNKNDFEQSNVDNIKIIDWIENSTSRLNRLARLIDES